VNKIRHKASSWQIGALRRAIAQYEQRLRIEPERVTRFTLQGQMETGWLVWGRAHGGDELGCLFATRQDAQDAITLAKR